MYPSCCDWFVTTLRCLRRRREFALAMNLFAKDCRCFRRDKWMQLYYPRMIMVAKCQRE